MQRLLSQENRSRAEEKNEHTHHARTRRCGVIYPFGRVGVSRTKIFLDKKYILNGQDRGIPPCKL